MRVLVMPLAIVLLMVLLMVPYSRWWTWGKPMPAVGEVWCGEPDGDPWHREQSRFYVLELKE